MAINKKSATIIGRIATMRVDVVNTKNNGPVRKLAVTIAVNNPNGSHDNIPVVAWENRCPFNNMLPYLHVGKELCVDGSIEPHNVTEQVVRDGQLVERTFKTFEISAFHIDLGADGKAVRDAKLGAQNIGQHVQGNKPVIPNNDGSKQAGMPFQANKKRAADWQPVFCYPTLLIPKAL